MIHMQLEFLSPTLNARTKINVLLPEFSQIKGKLPVLYLLHGLTGNSEDWLHMGHAKAVLSQYPLIAVLPSAQNSFYCDMVHGQAFYSHIAKELQDYIEGLLPIDQSQRYVCGLSMGGYGALKLALREPGRYQACGALSGVLDILEAHKNSRFPAEMQAAFGDKVKPEEDLFHLAKLAGRDKLPLYIACGTEDFLFPHNERFVQENPTLNILYTKEAGDHTWDFWEKHLAKFCALHFRPYSL